MAFSDAFLEDLETRVSVSDVATRAGLKLTRAGAEFKALSPFGDEKTPSFTINDQKRFFHCLGGDTGVITRDGTFPVSTLVGRPVLVMTKGGLWAGTVFRSYGIQPVWELIFTRNGIKKKIRATSEHRWFVQCGPNWRGQKEILTQHLAPEMRLVTQAPLHRDSRTAISPFGVAHGFVFGDGTLASRGSRAQFCGAKEPALLPYFMGARAYDYEDRTLVDGLPSAFKLLPSLEEHPSYLYGFVAGYFAADGCVSESGVVMLNSSRRENLEAIRTVCNRIGILTHGVVVQTSGSGYKDTDIYRIAFSQKTLGPEFFLLPKHRERFESRLATYSRTGWKVLSATLCTHAEEVFCCEVPGTRSFAIEDHILTGNCFSSGKHGNIFKFLMETKGLSFPDSVKEIAAIAGVALPNGEYKLNGSHALVATPAPVEKKERVKHEIVAEYPYYDNDGALLYSVVRMEPKTFRQRRPAPGHPGAWVWGLDAGEFVKHDRYPDFYAASPDRIPAKGWNVRLKMDEAVTHGLFNFPEIMEEMRQDEDDRRMVAIAEGERDCLTLKDMGVLATTNSGGAKHWQPHLAEYLRGADVVVLLDNDKPGRERGEMIARTLHGIARRVRVLDWKIHWPEVPDKGDVTDWRDQADGSKEKLYEIIEKLAPWSPAPYKSDFGAVTWNELSVRAQSYAFLIYGILPTRERAMMYGAPESGKSFAAMDMSLSVARGIPYEGRRVQQAGVIYCSWEGGRGFPNRVEGYRQWHGLEVTDNIPFVMLTRAADLFGDEEVMKKLQVEIEHWAKVFLGMGTALGLVVFDTVSASGGTMDENHGSDVAKYLNNGRIIAEAFNCTILYVHHIPKNGTTPRGSGKFTADLETTFSVHPDKDGACDDNGRPIRVLRLGKQREGEGNKDIKRFIIRKMEIGRDEFDEPMTTCVVLPPGGDTKTPARRGFHPTPQESKVFRALLDALEKNGTAPDPSMEVPSTIERIVTYAQWRDAYAEIDIGGDEEESTRAARIKTAMKRGGESLMKFKIIGKKEFDARNKIFWHTGEAVRGFPETFKRQDTYRRPVEPEPVSLSALGDDEF